jgi:hypothetical protein
MKRLIGPLRYLRLWHSSKAVVDIWLPLVFAIAITFVRYSFYVSPGLTGNDGLLSLLIPLLGALSGFYIAALTAISAFPIASLDHPMPGDQIVVLGEDSSGENPTRRQFLALQFGYLSFLSIFSFIVCVLGTYLQLPFICISHLKFMDFKLGIVLSWLGLLFIVFIISNLISVTIFSIYYLSDRIHRHEPTLEGGPDSPRKGPKVTRL